jgi:hypothetical protein
MTIGIYNILTTLWFILMLSCGSILTYMTWDKIFSSDIIFIAKFFVVLIYILSLGAIVFLLLKLRLLFVTKGKLTSLYLFRFKKTTIHIDEITTSKWNTWDIKAHKFITLTITDKSKNQVSISDFEFENFERIASSILGDSYLDKSIIYYKVQSKQNISFTKFIAILTGIFSILIIVKSAIDKDINYTNCLIFLGTFVAFLATIKRINKYRHIEKLSI